MIRFFSGFQIFFFFLFLANFSDFKKFLKRLILVSSLLFIVIFMIITLIVFKDIAADDLVFQYRFGWQILDLSYNLLGVVVYGVYAIPIFINLYKYNRDIRVFLSILGFISISLGFIVRIIFFSYINGNLLSGNHLSDLLYFLKLMADYFIFAGLVIFVLIYLIDSEYIYQLPYDQYFFFVSLKSGVLVKLVEFDSKYKKIEVSENSFSSLVYAINLLFSYLFQTKKQISYIESQDTTFYLCSGEKITSILVGNRITPVLIRSIKKFNQKFEQQFEEELRDTQVTLAQLEIPIEFFKNLFPYLDIRQKTVEKNPEIKPS